MISSSNPSLVIWLLESLERCCVHGRWHVMFLQEVVTSASPVLTVAHCREAFNTEPETW